MLIALSMVAITLQRWSVRRRNVAATLLRRAGPERLGPIASAVAHFVCYAIVLASRLPSLVVMFTSFRERAGRSSSRDSGSTATPGSSAKCRT